MSRNCPKIVAIVGCVISILGMFCSLYAFPKLLEYGISKATALDEDNEFFEMWKNPPFPLKLKMFIFNVTNADDVQQGAKPILTEMGPYVYDAYMIKENVTINEEEDTVTYMLKRKFHFNQKDTGCRSEDDMVTVVNGGLAGAALTIENMMPSAMTTINDVFPYLYKDAKDAFLHATVKTILSDGILISCHDPQVAFICGAVKSMLPPFVDAVNGGKDFKFSLFGYLNSTISGPFTIGRGMKNTTKGKLMFYKGKPNLDVWAGPTCNMINGSDTVMISTKNPPERIYAFSHDACRSIFLSYEKPTVFKGINVLKYTNKYDSLADNGPDECFCPRVKDEDYEDVSACPKPGLLNTAPCLQGHLLASFPHFYQAHPSLLKYARGIKPVKELHESYVYFEQTTGAPVDGVIRVQANVQLKRFEDLDLLANVSQGVCPIAWLELTTAIPEDYINQLKTGLTLIKVINIIAWILASLGIIMIISSCIWIMYKKRLLCFSNLTWKKVATTNIKENPNKMEIAKPISDMYFNSTVLYPSLYPQLEDKNMSDKLIRRHNLNNLKLDA